MYQMTAKPSQERKYAANRLKRVQDQESWMEDMKRSLIVLKYLHQTQSLVSPILTERTAS